jgi:cell division protein FtsI/penicillin-binding protein 2
MPRLIRHLLQTWAANRRARRRQANLRAGDRARVPPGLALVRRIRKPGDDAGARPAGRAWWLLVGAVLTAAGGALIAGHARHLGATVATAPAASDHQVRAATAYRAVLPGAAFIVPAQAGATTSLHPHGALLVVAGMQPAPAVRVDLCSQLRNPARAANDPRLLPLRLGYRFEDVQRWVAHNQQAANPVSLRNVLLVADSGAGAEAMPAVQIEGAARADFADPLSEPLRLTWHSRQGDARWIGDASLGQVAQGADGQVALRQQGWLLWGAASALRIERRANVLCPQAGELVVQLYRRATPAGADAGNGAREALVTAFPARGAAVRGYLAPGRYLVPADAAPALEDQALFNALQARGLLRLSAAGVIELAPRDLPQWLAADRRDRVLELDNWRHIMPGADTDKLFKRLYYQADGAYVRQQVAIFNGERRLLAWRSPAAAALAGAWRATVADAAVDGTGKNDGSGTGPIAVATTGQMPVAAARLFASLPQGWQPWTRVARWPQTGNAALPPVRLAFALPHAASGGEVLRLLVAGRVERGSSMGEGAAMRIASACTGRACTDADDVQDITLTVLPGVREVAFTVRPLAFSAPDDQQYRHLRLAAGQLIWQPLAGAPGQGGTVRAAPSPVRLADRNGVLLWDDGAPTGAAVEAGLAPLLGLGPEHASSIAGMLARLPATGAPVAATLTLDLPLQALSQRILECVGMRHGRWDGKVCAGGEAAPAGRHAGMVIVDTETGDVLAAAGAGAGDVSAANWTEVRDYDRTNPARSPLRLPALQHDGGAHQSPGSTFKVISALGLEMAAKADPQLDALLGGMPLPAINRLAQQRGFGFQTGAATYPLEPRLARITNYREQGLDRRAQEGRLGLAQALTYSLNTWFAWTGELSDRTLFGRADGGAPGVQALDADALDAVRPIVAAAHRLGFEQAIRLDGGLLPPDFNWRTWDALQATPAHIDTIHTRHELRQMAIGLRMQVTPLHMALASAAVGQGRVVAPRLLLALDGKESTVPSTAPTGVRLDRIKAGMKGVVDVGTGAGAFGGAALATVRAGLYGKTGTAPTGDDTATVWFTGWLEPGSLPGQRHRLALAAFVSHSPDTGGAHAAPVVAAVLSTLANQNREQRGK